MCKYVVEVKMEMANKATAALVKTQRFPYGVAAHFFYFRNIQERRQNIAKGVSLKLIKPCSLIIREAES